MNKKSNWFTDKNYLTAEQYHDADNLNARINLHLRFSTNQQDFREWTFSHFSRLPEISRVLELGCGAGGLWVTNAHQIPDSWEIILSDLSPGMVGSAKENLNGKSLNLGWGVVDAQGLPFPDEVFEAVVANHMLYHVPERPKALGEIERVLKPGGKLFAVTNGIKHMTELRALIQHLDPQAEASTVASLFGLENGMEQLDPFFSKIEIIPYEAHLAVTEVQPLMNYIFSMDLSDLIATDPQPARDAIEGEIDKNGAFHITNSVGMFIATKAES